MTPEEKREEILKFMREVARKGGLARAKNNTKEQIQAWGRMGGASKWKSSK